MLKIVIWDVQHGSAAYIKTPGGKHIVIDLGTGSYIGEGGNFSPLIHLKTSYGVKQLDEVIITHPHTDHIDDIFNFDTLIPKILSRPKHLAEDDIRKANKSSDSDKIDKYIEINNRYNTPVQSIENPTLPENNGGVKFSSFTSSVCPTSNINNHSIVTIIEYLGIKVIIPGDNGSTSWKELLSNNSFKNEISGTDIFVASHHGRESGYYSELFEYFTPHLVIVSDGAATDTSVTDKYSKVAKGWTVFRRSDKSSQIRKCVTTRKDGTIEINIYKSTENNIMNVTID